MADKSHVDYVLVVLVSYCVCFVHCHITPVVAILALLYLLCDLRTALLRLPSLLTALQLCLDALASSVEGAISSDRQDPRWWHLMFLLFCLFVRRTNTA